jgi:TonB family protein
MRQVNHNLHATFLFFVLAILFFLALSAGAQSTKLVSYRCELTPPNCPLVDTTISIQFSIYSDSIDGSSLWTEVHAKVKIYKSPFATKPKTDKCAFNVLLGTVTRIPDSVYAKKNRYLGAKIGNDPEMTPRRPISLDAELDGYLPLYDDASSEYLGNYGSIQPRFVKQRAPKYPPLARMSGVTGTVRVEVFIDKDGKVRDARIYMDPGTNAGLEEAAIEAVRGSEFSPTTIDGQPVAVRIIVPYEFRLAGKK